MAKKETNTTPEIQNVELVLSKTEQFIEKNQKKLLIGLAVVVAIVLVVLAFQNFYLKPRINDSKNAIYKAEQYFKLDSFKLALHGDGTNDMLGFKAISDEYSMTPSGKLATAYTGICYYKLNDYQNAIKFLTQYDGDDEILNTSILGLTGDAYAELGETDKAQDFYKKAINAKNELTPVYLKKAGILFETKGNFDEALKLYQQLKDEYPAAQQALDIDKYIARVQK